MSMLLRSAVVYTGEQVYARSIPDAQRAVEAACKEKGGFVAPVHLLLENWPHPERLTCATEELSGIVNTDVSPLRVKRGDCVVATYHGGVGGAWGLLPPETIDRALEISRIYQGGLNAFYAASPSQLNKCGLNKVNAAVISQLYKKDVFTPLIAEGTLPDGRRVQVFSYDQLLEGAAQENNRDCTPYVVVRPLALARKTVSGHETIDRLIDQAGNVTDSQVITYAGSRENAQGVIRRARDRFKTGKLGVWHPFNDINFKPKETQGRLVFLGSHGDLLGDNDLNYYGRLVRVEAAEPREDSVVRLSAA